MIHEEICTYEVCKLAKEKGFIWKCRDYYNRDSNLRVNGIYALEYTNSQIDEGKPLHGKGVAYRDKELTNNCYGTLSTTDDIRKGSTEKYPTSIIRYPKPHPSIAVHPTQKSVELCEWLIKTYTREGDVVLDNCMGSGSTMVACVKTRRLGIGIEKDDNYYNIAQERVKTSLITSAL